MGPGERIVILGRSISSSRAGGHASTYRGLVAALAARGHDVLFLERDAPELADHRDLRDPPFCTTVLYRSLEELRDLHGHALSEASLVVVGSHVPEGPEVARTVLEQARGVRAFHDHDTPATLQSLEAGRCDHLEAGLVERFDVYLASTGGAAVQALEQVYRAPLARPLHGSADPDDYRPDGVIPEIELGYMGSFGEDRQIKLVQLLFEPARHLPGRRFLVSGTGYPAHVRWPANVERSEGVDPDRRRAFYNLQSFTLSLSRSRARFWGYSPSVQLFEAAACGVPVITDVWRGLGDFFVPDREILLAHGAQDSLRYLQTLDPEEREAIGKQARRRVLAQHTTEHRAEELEGFVKLVRERRAAAAAKQRRQRAASASRRKPASGARKKKKAEATRRST